MSRSRLLVALWFLTPAVLLGLTPAAPARVVVVAVKSATALTSGYKYLRPFALKMPFVKKLGLLAEADKVIREVNDPKNGIDLQRPFGLYMDWSATAGDIGEPVFFVPVTDEQKFLKAADREGFKVHPPRKELHRLSQKGKTVAYLRFQKQTAYLAAKADLLRGQLPDPKELVPPLGTRCLATVRVNLLAFPRQGRDQFLAAMKKEFKPDPQEKGESTAVYRAGLIFQRRFADWFVRLCQGTREIVLNFEIDPKADRLALDLALVPQPNGPLAASFKQLGAAGSQFNPLVRQADTGLCARLPLPREWTAIFRTVALDELAQMFRSRHRALGRRLIDALLPTLEAGVLDVGVATDFSDSSPFGGLLAGIRLRKGRQLEHVLRDAFKDLSAAERFMFLLRWNHARFGKVKIHQVRLRSRYHRVDIYLAVTDEVLYVSPSLKRLTGALGRPRKTPPPDPALIRLELGHTSITVGCVFALMAARDPGSALALARAIGRGDGPTAQAGMKKFFATPAAKRLHGLLHQFFKGVPESKVRLRLTVRGGAALHLRLDVTTQLLGLIPVMLEALAK
jgi:hypothetical protein